MKRLFVASLACLLVVGLAGCFGKDKGLSDAEMRERVLDAMAGLEADLGPEGRISGADLTIPVEAGPVVVQLPLKLAIGPSGDLLLTGSIGNPFDPSAKATIKAYCSESRLIVVTAGIQNFDANAEDISVEGRNTSGTCLEVDDDLRDMFGGFGGVADLARNDGRLRLESVSRSEGAIEGVYIDHQEDAEIRVLVDGGRVEIINAAVDEGDLHIDFHYGTRSPVTVPRAVQTLPITVGWSTAHNGDHAKVTIEGNGSVIEDYHVRIYDRSASVPCRGGPAPIVTFDLTEGRQQTVQGYRMDLFDDGDDLLSDGDTIILRHPDPTKSDWRHKVEVWDGWADTSAHPFCGIPATPAPLIGIGLMGLAAAVRRYQ